MGDDGFMLNAMLDQVDGSDRDAIAAAFAVAGGHDQPAASGDRR